MNSCEHCRWRAKYDRNPQSIIGRIWRWHMRWCPGWKSYLRSLPEDKRVDLMKSTHKPAEPQFIITSGPVRQHASALKKRYFVHEYHPKRTFSQHIPHFCQMLNNFIAVL